MRRLINFVPPMPAAQLRVPVIGPEIPGAPKSVPAKAFPSAVVHVTEAVCPAAGVVRDTAMFTDATPSVVVTLVAVNWIESAWAAVAAMEASSPANRKRIFIFEILMTCFVTASRYASRTNRLSRHEKPRPRAGFFEALIISWQCDSVDPRGVLSEARRGVLFVGPFQGV